MLASRYAHTLTLAAGFVLALPALSQSEETSARGIVRSVDEAWISTDLGFRVETLPFREGQAFKRGDVLATFDCGDLAAELKSAEAQLKAEQITYENNSRLAKLNAVGKFEVALSKAKAEQASAALEAYRSKFARCTIKAPFDGRVAVMRAHPYEIPDRTQPIMQIVGLSQLEIEILLPSPWLKWLKPGVGFDLRIEETDQVLPAEVLRVSAVVDPVSQTVKVIGRFTGEPTGVLPGMSGPASFKAPDG